MGNAFNLVERKEAAFLKFTEGLVVTGILQRIDRIQIEGKSAIRYTMHDLESDEPVSFLGAYQIDSKIRPADVGHVVEIRYEGEDKTVQRNGNSMKKFRVFVSDKKPAEALEIAQEYADV